MAARILEALKNPWTVGFSAFGLAYGGYNVIEWFFNYIKNYLNASKVYFIYISILIFSMTQAGKKYEMEEDLTGKTYIVTGATSGIGKTLTQKLADKNARVIMACRLIKDLFYGIELFKKILYLEIAKSV